MARERDRPDREEATSNEPSLDARRRAQLSGSDGGTLGEALGALVDALEGVIFRCAPAEPWTMRVVSEGIRELIGLSPEEFVEGAGADFLGLIHPEDRARVRRSVEEAAREARAYRVNYRLRNAQGAEVWVRELGRTIFDEQGAPREIAGFLVDITELVERESHYKSLFESHPDAVVIISPEDGTIVEANEAAQGFYGMPVDELKRHKLADILEVGEEDLKLRLSSSERGRACRFTAPTRTKRGHARHAEVSCGTIRVQGKEGLFVAARDVTKGVDTVEGLRKTEALQRAIVATSPVALYSIDLDGKVTTWNKSAERVFGWSADEVVGQALPIVPPDKQEEFGRFREEAGAGHCFADREVVRLTKHRGLIECSLSVALIHDPGGQVVGIMGAAEDISGRKAAQRALQASEARFRHVFESANVGKSLTLPSGEIEVNKCFADMLGFTVEELQDRFWQELTPAEEIPGIEARLAPLIAGDVDETRFEKRYLHKDGGVVWADVSVTMRRDERGKPLHFITTVVDITRQKEAAEELKRSKERFQRMIEQAPDPVFLQTGGCFRFLNMRAMELFGTEQPGELVGTPVLERMHPDDRAVVAERIRALNEDKRPAPILRETYLRVDGTPVPVEVSAQPIDHEGEPGALVFVRDISERVTFEREQEKLRAQLLQAQKLETVGRLAGGVAHDFNNLLSVIRGYGEFLLEEIPRGHAHREPVEEIDGAARRAALLTRQLLAFSRKQVLDLKTLDLNEIVRGFDRFLQRVLGEDVRLDLELSGEPLLVNADGPQLEQVIMNLAVNARDAMPEGGVLTIETTRVHLDESYAAQHTSVEPGDYGMLAVSDTGEGMDKETLALIFEPFFTTKGSTEGTGLGLATSYGIVKQHRGNIWVYSEPDRGTTFKIYLPLDDGALASDEESDSANAASPRACSVLIVEDDDAVRRLAHRMLEHAGHRVASAGSAEEALAIAEDLGYKLDLVLTDVVMPGKKGPEVFEEVRKLQPDARVLYMSGYTDNVIAQRGILKEGVHFIQKPFTMKGLIEKIDEALGRTRS